MSADWRVEDETTAGWGINAIDRNVHAWVLLPDAIVIRSGLISETIENLRQKMEAAALALDFEKQSDVAT